MNVNRGFSFSVEILITIALIFQIVQSIYSFIIGFSGKYLKTLI
jgi:hypothetical protein